MVQGNADLEQKVDELTQELNETKAELERMRQHMLHMDKMSMLGEMVSGIAHEINNPINFIYGNLPYVEEHVEDLFTVLETYDEAYPDKTEEVEETLEDVEVDYIEEDLPRIVKSLKVGAERIRDLVLSLRSFYRRDEADMKESDLTEGINNTLTMLNNRYKQNIEVVLDLDKIPQIECYVNQINQVFMNLISNAIDILLGKHWSQEEDSEEGKEETPKPPKKKRKIAIAAKALDNKGVSITVTDNGPGIPEDIQSQIFEPFFTTKPMGIGSGLGLSISRKIVEDTHGGRIYVTSTPGEGATFTVELPISQSLRSEFANS